MLVAPVATQESATAAPAAVDGFGVAVNDVIFTAGFTFTVTCAVTLPAGLVAVRVYVVVAVGLTSCDAPSDTLPMVTVTAALQDADVPFGPLAVTVYVVDAVGVTTTLPFAPTVPPPLLMV